MCDDNDADDIAYLRLPLRLPLEDERLRLFTREIDLIP